jgi:hypothetical protein
VTAERVAVYLGYLLAPFALAGALGVLCLVIAAKLGRTDSFLHLADVPDSAVSRFAAVFLIGGIVSGLGFVLLGGPTGGDRAMGAGIFIFLLTWSMTLLSARSEEARGVCAVRRRFFRAVMGPLALGMIVGACAEHFIRPIW